LTLLRKFITMQSVACFAMRHSRPYQPSYDTARDCGISRRRASTAGSSDEQAVSAQVAAREDFSFPGNGEAIHG